MMTMEDARFLFFFHLVNTLTFSIFSFFFWFGQRRAERAIFERVFVFFGISDDTLCVCFLLVWERDLYYVDG
jgi:ABC-type multidrug transport system fused ATPase/permease subunit